MSKKILIVEDNTDFAWSLSKLLTSYNYQTFIAADGISAFKIIQENPIDLVLLDLRLPGGMDGIEILEKLHSQDHTLPVIVITAYSTPEKAVESTKLGAVDYFVKPFNNDQLLASIDKALKKHRIERITPPMAQKRTLVLYSLLTGLFSIAVISMVVVFIIKLPKPPKPREIKNYPIPVAHASALTTTVSGKGKEIEKKLWFTDWFAKKVYRYSLPRFIFESGITLENTRPSGIAISEGFFWVCDPWRRKIFKFTLTDEPVLLGEYPTPGRSPTGITFDGKYLWSTDAVKAKIYCHHFNEDLAIKSEYDAPGKSPAGIYWDGKTLWSADAETRCIYKHKLDNDLTVEQEYDYAEIPLGSKGISGFTIDGGYVWLCSEGVGKLFRVTLSVSPAGQKTRSLPSPPRVTRK